MPDTLNVPIIEERKEEFDTFTPSEKEQAVLTATTIKFRSSQMSRNQRYEYMDGLNPVEYWEDSVRRFTTNIDEREDIEDWQSRIHDPMTHNKALATLGQQLSTVYTAAFKSRGSQDPRKGMLLTDLYQFSEDVADDSLSEMFILLDAIVKGVGIGYEAHLKKTRTIRDKAADGTITEKKEKVSLLYTENINPEEFYPAHMSHITVDEHMPYCFWRKVMPFESFRQSWSVFERAELVSEKRSFADEDDRPYYMDYISNDVADGMVEIIRYYNRDTDEYIIIANGIWLNPANSNEEVEPLPFEHKELPFWDVKYDVFGSKFFIGKSLPDRLKTLQDTLNVLTNMLMDQSFMTIFPPLLTSGVDNIEDDFMRPGRRTPIDTQGLPLQNQFMQLEMSVPSGWHQYILEYTRKVMEESSVDAVSSGIAGAGDRTTAEEIKRAAAGVSAVMTLFSVFRKRALKRKAKLRASNLLQFWTDKDSPYRPHLSKISDNTKAFVEFEIDNADLGEGRHGTKIIELYATKEDLPDEETLKARSVVAKIRSKKDVEIVAVTGEYIRQIDFDTSIILNPRAEQTQDAEKALQLEKTKVYVSFFPDMVDMRELAAQTALKMGDDPSKILKSEVFESRVDKGAVDAQQAQPESPRPQSNLVDNTVRGMKGGEQGPTQLRDLAG